MSYTVFARKYRPQTFDEVVGQDHIVRTLKNAIEQNRLAQAYLFVGPRGTGKTTTARILAKALNCTDGPRADFDPNEPACQEIADGRSMNVLEFDAASNTQVDKIREIIIDNVKYAPTGSAKFKVYIVDEVHMLSTSSFNALLKTLEEPPPHVKFVFATTDVQKVPTTIISRCQRFDLRRISTPEIAKHLLYIAGNEKIALSPDAAETIARGAEGGLRDAESMLDQLVAFCGEKIAEADVLNIFGFTSAHTVAALCDHLIAGDAAQALRMVQEQSEAGKDLSRLMADLIAHFRNLLVIQCDPAGVKDELSDEAIAGLAEQSQRISRDKLLDLIEQFAKAESAMKWAPNKKMHFEIAAIRAIQTLNQATLTEVIDTLAAMRDGAPLPAAPAKGEKKEARNIPAPAAAPQRSLSAMVGEQIGAKPTPKSEPAPKPAPAPEATTKIREESAPTEIPALSASELWTQFVARVRKERPLIQGWVEAGVLTELTGNIATVAFPPEASLARETVERTHRKFIENLLGELAGRPLTMKCIAREGLVVETIAPTETKSEPPPDPAATFRDDPLIKKALAAFNAEIIAE